MLNKPCCLLRELDRTRTLDRILSDYHRDHVMHVKGALRKRPR